MLHQAVQEVTTGASRIVRRTVFVQYAKYIPPATLRSYIIMLSVKTERWSKCFNSIFIKKMCVCERERERERERDSVG